MLLWEEEIIQACAHPSWMLYVLYPFFYQLSRGSELFIFWIFVNTYCFYYFRFNLTSPIRLMVCQRIKQCSKVCCAIAFFISLTGGQHRSFWDQAMSSKDRNSTAGMTGLVNEQGSSWMVYSHSQFLIGNGIVSGSGTETPFKPMSIVHYNHILLWIFGSDIIKKIISLI